ncbi:MAG: FHA domain-containing protein [Verrucomicrobiota bacterium]
MSNLTLYIPDAEPMSFSLEGAEIVTLGRGADNQIQLEHASISGSHAVIRLVDGAHKVVDMNSTNGTYVNGEAITEFDLNPGDRVRFGHVEGVFHLPEDAGAAEESAPEYESSGGSSYGGPVAELAESSIRPSGFTDLSPVEKVVKKDSLAQLAMIIGVVGLVAVIASGVLSALMAAG